MQLPGDDLDLWYVDRARDVMDKELQESAP
jgi:hypothetical protein